MSFTQYLNPSEERFTSMQVEEKMHHFVERLYEKFLKCNRFYALFHTIFFAFLALQAINFLLFFSFFSKSSTWAFALGFFFLTLFSYFVLSFFFQAKKPQQLLEILEEFTQSCHNSISFAKGSHEYHLSIANALHHFVHYTIQQETAYYACPPFLKPLSPLPEKWQIWSHWQNFHMIKERFLTRATQELIQLVKAHPLDPEAHAALASAFAELSTIYLSPKETESRQNWAWIPPEYATEEMHEKFLASSRQAIEELQILQDLQGQNPWIHAQLATLYHYRKEKELEILQYELLSQMQPSDVAVLLKLGTLYFEQGHFAKGLRIYDQVMHINLEQANALIACYDAYRMS